jgi:periplasmic protein TonB
MEHLTRNALIASSVVLLHGAALWALQAGTLRRTVERVVLVQLEADVETLQPSKAQPSASAEPSAKLVQRSTAARVVRNRAPPLATPDRASPLATPHRTSPLATRHRTLPLATPHRAAPPAASPAAHENAASVDAQPPDTPMTADPGSPVEDASAGPKAAAATAAHPGRATAGDAALPVELPVSDADYLHNPAPKWPRLSERLGEHGRVMLRVLIGTDGRPKSAQVKESSGYRRLDDASVEAAMSWRYVPGKRGGVPQDMWVNVPIRWGD